jgi:Tetratricopeptide repeat
MRTVFRSTPASAWKEILHGIVKASGISGEVSDWKVSDPAAIKEPFEVDFKIAANRFANWTSKRITVPLPLADDMVSPPESDAKAVELGAAPMEVSYKLQLRLPADVTVRAPLPVAISRDYADYRASYTISGSTLTAERVVSVRKSELPADRSQDYAAFVRVVDADAKQTLLLETSAPIAAAPLASDLKAAELHRQGYAALEAGKYAEAVALLKRVVELEPKDKVAWNNLGRAHAGLRELEAAIVAYRKQIEVNPYDAYVYNACGSRRSPGADSRKDRTPRRRDPHLRPGAECRAPVRSNPRATRPAGGSRRECRPARRAGTRIALEIQNGDSTRQRRVEGHRGVRRPAGSAIGGRGRPLRQR